VIKIYVVEGVASDYHHLLSDLMCTPVDHLECTPQIKVPLSLNGQQWLGVVALPTDVDKLA
jgi:hypothetical protein